MLWRGVEISACPGFDTVSVGAEIHCIGIHRKDLLLAVDRFQLGGYNPFLALDDKHPYSGNVSQKSGGILRPNAKHVFGQLLCDG